MTEKDLNLYLMDTFPEIKDELLTYMQEDGDGLDTGCFLTHEDVLHPFISAALKANDSAALTRVGSYIDALLDMNDEYAENIATVALIEWLACNCKEYDVRPYLGAKACALYKSYKTED